MGESPAGWYPAPDGPGQRYFDGATWTDHRAAGLTLEQRQQILDNALIFHHARVLTRTPTTAAAVAGQPVNHVAHLLACVFLCGLWLPGWILIAATGGEKHATITVDEQGQVHWVGPGGAVYRQPVGPSRPSPFTGS